MFSFDSIDAETDLRTVIRRPLSSDSVRMLLCECQRQVVIPLKTLAQIGGLHSDGTFRFWCKACGRNEQLTQTDVAARVRETARRQAGAWPGTIAIKS